MRRKVADLRGGRHRIAVGRGTGGGERYRRGGAGLFVGGGRCQTRRMWFPALRVGGLLVGASGVLVTAGCGGFVGAGCETDGCASESEQGSTTSVDPTSSIPIGTSGGETSEATGTTNVDPTALTTTSSAETTDTSDTQTSQTSTDTSTTTGTDTTGTEGESADPLCGDGMVEGSESCDDENMVETDGCLSTCVVPRSCAEILAEVPGVSDGTYDIAPDGALLTTACDMTTEGGGWTLVGKVNHADMDGVAEPVDWFGTASNPAGLAVPDLTLNASPESHGAGRFSPIIAEGASLTRFELIQGGSLDESVEWFKFVRTTNSFESWFSEVDTDASMVCTDVAMTANCSDATIQTQGGGNNVTALGGMRITHYLPAGDDYPIHIRQDNNNPSGSSGVISGTVGLAEWTPGYGDHNGNGLRIWLRE